MAFHRIEQALPLEAGVLRIRFATGEERLFDVGPFLQSDFFRQLSDPAYFRQVRVEEDTITWPNGQDFDPGTVYARSAAIERSTA